MQIAVAVLVAILGIVNTLTVSITDRRRELGVLQAVGGLHGQIRRTIWIEALSIGVLGLVLGFALGAMNLYYILQIVHRDIAGMRLDYQFPVSVTLALVPTMLVAALVAAIWPAESAVRGSLVEALEYEVRKSVPRGHGRASPRRHEGCRVRLQADPITCSIP